MARVTQATDWSIATQIEQFNADIGEHLHRSTGFCRIFTKATGAPLDADLAKRKAEGSHASKWWDERSAHQQRFQGESGYTAASVSDDAAFAAYSAMDDLIGEARATSLAGIAIKLRVAMPDRQRRRTTRRQHSGRP